MVAFSFRFKLLVGMMLAVATVAGATLYITERKVQAAYEKLFKDKLQSQITYLPKEQEARLSRYKETCWTLVSKNVRLLGALKERDLERLYQVAEDELRPILAAEDAPTNVEEDRRKRVGELAKTLNKLNDFRKSKGLPPLSPGSPALPEAFRQAQAAGAKLPAFRPEAPPQRRNASFLLFLDAEGRMLPNPKRDLSELGNRDRMLEQLAKIGSAVTNIDSQVVGYINPHAAKNQNLLLEIIVSPVIDSVTREFNGALIIGFKFADRAEQTISEVSDIENGVWLEGRLFTRTIPEAAARELTRRLPEEISSFPEPREDFIIAVTNIPNRVFYTPLNPDSPLPVAYKVGLYSWEAALRAQAEVQSQILGFSALALLGALAFSLLLSHGLSVPLKELVSGTAEIQRGNFEVKVPVRSRDEIGQLATSFNEMAQGLALKEKYHNVLNMIADKDVAQQLMSGKVALGGELREVSVMFCDIRGFTALTQNMDPAEVIHMLNEHMTALTKVIYDHNGVVDKFIGDSIMAVFGAPKSYGNDAHNAARAALRMIQERAKLNETSHYHISIGIGIATGTVLAGNMGSANRSNYTVIGERVNLAARLCSVAGPREIVIGQTTRDKLGDLVGIEEMPDLRLKGFSEAVRAYRLLEVRSLPVPV